MRSTSAALLLATFIIVTDTRAEIVSSSDSHFVLHLEASSSRTLEAMWQRLIDPASWWHPDHTYSGDANNLSLDLKPGGLWQETWDGGAVAHGEVLLVQDRKVLRLNAPFGPLQGVGAYTIWTITIEAAGDGSRVVFDEVSTGPETANMDELAAAVDFVKTEAINRLTAD